MLLEMPDEQIAGKIYKAGCQNYTIAEVAEFVRDVVQCEVPGKKEIGIVTPPSHDRRSYRISSERIKRTIEDAVRDLVAAFQTGKNSEPMTDIRFHNIKTMQAVNLS